MGNSQENQGKIIRKPRENQQEHQRRTIRKPIGTSKDIRRKTIGNSQENHRQFTGKPEAIHRKTMGNSQENHGKFIGRSQDNHGKFIGQPWEIHRKTIGKCRLCWKKRYNELVYVVYSGGTMGSVIWVNYQVSMEGSNILIGKSAISMAIFNSYINLQEDNTCLCYDYVVSMVI